jgi:HAMP domain-containing protein
LANAAERVSMGDLDAAIDVTAGDEVGDLAKRFHRMRESIRITMQSAGGVL